MLSDLTIWWLEQMRGLVPASLRSVGRAGRRTLTIKSDGAAHPTVELTLQTRRGGTALGRHALTLPSLRDAASRLPARLRRSATLQVSPDLVVEREVVLPMAAERELRNLIGFEMDRLTPFSAEEVLWTCHVRARDPVRDRLTVQLSLIPIASIKEILAALIGAGIIPERIESVSAPDARCVIPLAAGSSRAAWEPRATRCALAGCVVLGMVAAIVPFVMQSLAATTLESRAEAVRDKVAEADRLRNAIVRGAVGADAIEAARDQAGAVLQVLAVLTRAFPDDSHLVSLDVHQRSLAVSGRSAGAARLIGAMTADTAIRNPAFTAPVLRDETSGGEMFSIRAEMGR
jgi:general secretion pathway protein L